MPSRPPTPDPAAEFQEFLRQLVQNQNRAQTTPEMPAKSQSSAPKFDDEPANLESYFRELEYQFDRCRITSDHDRKVQAVRYLDATQCDVWRGAQAYEDHAASWDNFKDEIFKLYPGSGRERRINLSDIIAFVDANARTAYPNEKELGAYYRQLLSKTRPLLSTNRLTKRDQSLIYLRGLPDLLQQQTLFRIRVKDIDRHPEDLLPIDELYQASAFCVLGGGMTAPIASTAFQGAPTLAPFATMTTPTLFGLAPRAPASATQAPVAPAAPQPAPAVPVSPNQPLPFAPGLRPEDFSTMLANSIADKLSTVFANQRSTTRDRAPQGQCLFCGQPNHYARNCDVAARYITENRCARDAQGRFAMPDGSGIRRAQGETFQQTIDRLAPTRVSAIIELVSPQVAASSFVSSVVTPTAVAMYVAEPEDTDSEDESIHSYAASCEDDLDELSVDDLQLLVRTLSGQLKKSSKSAQSSARAPPRKKKGTDAPTSTPAEPTPVTAPQVSQPSSTNSAPTPPTSKIITPKPVASQTVVPHVRFSDQKGKSKDSAGPDFHYQCPIENKADAKKVFDRILDVSVPVTARELLSLSTDVRKQAKEATTTRKVKGAAYVAVDPTSAYLQSLDACDCHDGLIVAKESHALRSIVPIIDGCMAVECILDSGCQIVGMSRAVWMALKKELNPSHTVSMQSANGTVDRSLGIVENLTFRFGTIELLLQVHVIEDPAYDILLGRPFDVLTESSIKNFRNEDQTITITDPNDSRRVATMQTHPRGPPKFHAQKRREGF